MLENLILFTKALKKHSLVLALVCLLLISGVYVRLSSQDVYASVQIACINISSAIMEKDDLNIKQTNTYYLTSLESEEQNPQKDFMILNANSSLYYIYEVNNISSKTIECQLKYDYKASKNFNVTYSFDKQENTLTNTTFSINPYETKLVYIHIFVDDLSLDARIDGSVSITVCSVSGV